MPNTSASGGPLVPSSVAPPSDLDLDILFGRLVRGISGLGPGLVRPRWQSEPVKQPEPGTDWCAVGVTRTTPDGANAAIIHDPAGAGTDTVRRHEIIEVLASFYGPNAQRFASLTRDGLAVAQNREPLFHANMGFMDVGPIVPAPALINTQFVRRQDLTFRVRRRIDRTYPVRNLLEAGGTFHAENHPQTWTTEN